MRAHAPPRLLQLHGPSRIITVPGSEKALVGAFSGHDLGETSQRFVDSSTGFWLLYPGDGAAVVAVVGLLLLLLLGHRCSVRHAAIHRNWEINQTNVRNGNAVTVTRRP